jgi:Methylamine utilisation protein MauE
MSPESTIVLQLAIGIVFVLSSAPKIRRPIEFARAMTGYGVIPSAWSLPVAIAIVSCEACIALAHLSGVLLQPAIVLCIALLLVLLLTVLRVLRRGTAVRCACFGSAAEVVSGRTLARVLLLLGAEMLLWFGTQAAAPRAELRLEQIIGGAMVAVLYLTLLSWLFAVPDFRVLLRRAGWSSSGKDLGGVGRIQQPKTLKGASS